ncbi:oxaloacetate decarboxylase subunit gamma [Rodentibacter trehalosifermentans]|uniref:Probable oxaloacetate decarboxylase gamma chain n=1 Tax=Rodentibacter trehalosifermentans TaxID=1908263 RepID=A0A1V3J3S9_9PAST|nr:oxaloacetate decarboxylase subunit gamma [Rodentibacter trehalosifermentans]OOF43686.1 oxaloacetate decarboxylase gamma chain [Rodentibacter trehalosifermentans]OOF49765.1 oxaloacetate decarboxylase gamma chain [Rodentibacter trehalosifermentans]OOF51626.1 oxaloacetate decarboxylase gamma chain [Rodentibacter trehalosifermentans]
MTSSELMFEGFNLMFAGMGFVIFFLFLLIYAIKFSSSIINQFFPEKTPTTQTTPSSTMPISDNDAERLRPIIVAAIAHHRRQQGLK